MDTVIVASSQFYSHYPKRIPKGTVNAEAVLVRLDPEWDNLTVRIHWINVASGVEKVVLLERDKPNTIPWEVLDDLSELRMGLDGMDGGTIVKPTVWLTYGYVVDGVDPESGSDPQPPTPSWEQQMVEQATAAANAAKAAKETADNLQASAEAGEFNGDPGPAGPPGKSPIIQDGNWWLWDVEAQEYRDTGIAASGGGGGGTTNYQDLSNKPSVNGVELLGDKTAQDLGLQPKGDYATTSSKLANPFFITFTGAVEATYDGSQAVTVTIPTIAGPPGVSPTVATEEIDGGTRVTFEFKGGSETVDLLNGKTPVKGIDYGTEQDIQEIAKQAAALVPSGGKLEKTLLSETTDKEVAAFSVTEGLEGIKIIRAVIGTPAVESNSTYFKLRFVLSGKPYNLLPAVGVPRTLPSQVSIELEIKDSGVARLQINGGSNQYDLLQPQLYNGFGGLANLLNIFKIERGCSVDEFSITAYDTVFPNGTNIIIEGEG